MSTLEELVKEYKSLGIDRQLDYDKFYLYSIITHSTAIEGSTITELENQIMFDNGIALKGKSLIEQNMNLDLKAAYEQALVFAQHHESITPERLKTLAALTMKIRERFTIPLLATFHQPMAISVCSTSPPESVANHI